MALPKPKRRSYNSAGDVLNAFRADFEAGKVNRFNRRRNGIAAMGSGADYHYRNENCYLRIGEYARDMDRNDMVVGSLVDRAIDNQIQGGFRIDISTGDAKLDADLSSRWNEERENPAVIDHEETRTFADFERLTCREIAVVGDVFHILTDEGKMQVREQHRCRTPYNKGSRTIIHGVELFPESRRRKSYWFTRGEIDPFTALSAVKLKDVEEVPSQGMDGCPAVLHCYHPKRFSQTRGITAFAPVFSAVGMHDDIQFATLLQRQVLSSFGWVEKRSEFYDPASDGDTGASYDTTTSLALQDVHPGMIVRPPKGVELQAFSADVPGSEYFPHVKLILTFIGINLGMPLVMALMDASETSFSGYRGAVDQARLSFRVKQDALKRQLHRPYWCHKVRYWGLEDRQLQARIERWEKNKSGKVNPFHHEWHAPSWPYIQPQEDATANMLRLATGQTSRRRLDIELGMDPEAFEANEDRAAEIRDAIIRARSINEEFGLDETSDDRVRWMQICTLPMPDQVRINISKSDTQTVGPNQPNKSASGGNDA